MVKEPNTFWCSNHLQGLPALEMENEVALIDGEQTV